MKTSLLCCTLFVFTAFYATAQKKIDPTPEHIKQAKSLKEVYPDSDIVILNSDTRITFGLDRKNGTVIVNKELKEELMNISPRADIQKFEFYDDKSEITKFALKYRNNKTKPWLSVKDEFYESGDLFYHDARVKYTNIDFPVQGYKYFFELDKRYDDAKYFTKIFLDGEYAVSNKKITFAVPDWLDIELKEFHFDRYDIDVRKVENTKQAITEHVYTITNIPALAKEENTPGPTHYRPHILILAKSYNEKGEKKTLFADTKDLYKWYKSLVDDVEDDSNFIKEKVHELTANAVSDEEKIKNIYYWVQDNIRYIAFEDGIAGFKPDESQNVFKKRYGDCKGMANLTKQMLKEAGFDARLTWLGTKRIAYDYSLPSLSVDNHMICTLFKGDKKYYLDGTEKYNAYGEYAERIQGRPVLIENGDDFILDNVPVEDASTNKETSVSLLAIDGESLTGTTKRTFKGESRASFLYNYNSLKTDKKEDALTYFINGGDKGFVVKEIQTSDLEDREDDLTLTYKLSLANKVLSYDGEMYIDLENKGLFKYLDLSERKVDYEFGYKKDVKYITELQIPKGYHIKELPSTIEEETSDFKVFIGFSKKRGKLLYKRHFVLKNASITTKNFEKWNEVLAKIKELYQEQIILSKS